MSPVKGSLEEWNQNEGLRACGTPNPSLSDVAHEGLKLCQQPEPFMGDVVLARVRSEAEPLVTSYIEYN